MTNKISRIKFDEAKSLLFQRDYREAEKLLSELVSDNYPPAMFVLGFLYLDDDNFISGRKNGLHLLRKAKKAGHLRAIQKLNSIEGSDPKVSAIKLVKITGSQFFSRIKIAYIRLFSKNSWRILY